MTNNTIDFAADREGASEPSAADQLSRVGKMADTLTNAQISVASAETVLQGAEDVLRRITREEFPELLREVRLSEVTLEDKRKIVLSDEIDCGISEENKAAAFNWLRENNFAGLIKTSIVIEFSRGEDEELLAALKVINAHLKKHLPDRVPEVKEGVHYQTLKSFVKEQRAAGKPVPEDLFGIFPYSKVDVKHPKGSDGFKLKRIFEKKK